MWELKRVLIVQKLWKFKCNSDYCTFTLINYVLLAAHIGTVTFQQQIRD